MDDWIIFPISGQLKCSSRCGSVWLSGRNARALNRWSRPWSRCWQCLGVVLCRAIYQVPKSLNTRYCHSHQNGSLYPGFEALWRYLLSDLEWYVRSTNYLPDENDRNTLFPDSLTGFVLCFESTIHASTSWTAFAPLRLGYNLSVFS